MMAPSSLPRLAIVIRNAYRNGFAYDWMVETVTKAAPYWPNPSELPRVLQLVDEVYGVPPVGADHRGSRA